MSGLKCRPFSNEELSKIISVMKSPRDRALVILGIRTGFRISELLSIQVKDILNNNNEIVTHLVIQRRNMKGKYSTRSVPLHPEARSALSALLASNSRYKSLDTYIFKSLKGYNKPIKRNQAIRIIQDACIASGIDIQRVATHSLRKTFAFDMYLKLEKNIYKLQKAMGHQSLDSTGKYIEVDMEEINELICK